MGVFAAYKALRPRAYRADLWRQLILWDQGGMYMDAKLYLSSPLDWVDWDNDEYLVCGDHNQRFNTYTNGMIISTQYHPVRLEIILEAVHKITARLMPHSCLDLTGPALQSRIMKNSQMLPNKRFYCLMHLSWYETPKGERADL